MKKIILALMLALPLAAQTPPGETQITINSFTPANVTVNPQESSTFTNAFTTTALVVEIKDTLGFGDVDKLQVVVSATQPVAGAQAHLCSMRFDQQTQGFGLLSDDGASWSDAMASNSYDGLENSQCTMLGLGTTIVSQSGQLVKVQFNVGFSPTFTGQMGLWVYARNAASTVNTGYIRKGTIMVNAPPGIGGLTLTPVNQYQHIALMPYEQIEFDATCTQPLSDPISKLQLAFTAVPSGYTSSVYNDCAVRYDAKNEVFNILLYVNTSCGQFCTYKVPTWSANIIPGSTTSISSGACQLNGAGSYATGEGTTLFVAFNLTLSGDMSKSSGTSSNFESYMYLLARNEANTVSTGFVEMGTWFIWQP